MVVNTQQYEYTSQQRELMIIKYIRAHQRCTKSDITRGLKGIISKKTIGRLVDEMINNEVEIKKEKRNHKLYLKEDNLLVSVP